MDRRSWAIPASLFGIVLGLAGLGNDWRAASRLWALPGWIGEAVMAAGALTWLALMALYIRKWASQRQLARDEVADPVQCCFVALVPVSTMLMAIAVLPYSRALALPLFALGAICTLAFGVWRHGALWRGGRRIETSTAVLYLPTVAGNFVSAIALGSFGWPEVGQLFFGAGLLSWLAIESVLLQRLLTGEEMALPLRPTLGIQLAPPAVGMLAWVSVTDGPATLASHMLLGYALLQCLLLARLLPWIVGQGFAPGYWAFSFGLSALSLAVLRLEERGPDGILAFLAPLMFIVANIVIGGLFIASLVNLLRGRFLAPLPAGSRPAT